MSYVFSWSISGINYIGVVMINIKRLFSSDYEPWCPQARDIEIDISGSILKFTCPDHYSWSGKASIQSSYVDKESAIQLLSRDQFRISREGFSGKLIFYREWSHWGRVFRPRYIAVSSFRVWLVHVPKKTESDSLHRFDYLREKFPLFSVSMGTSGVDLIQGEKITNIGSGILGKSGQKQRPSVDSACIKSESGRETHHYSIYSLSSEYALVFEIYQVLSPKIRKSLMDDLIDKSEIIIKSFRLDMNEYDLKEKERVMRRFADELGATYYEDEGVIF